MKKILLSIITVFFVFSVSYATAGDVWVNGYTRSNGTYVRGHYRSSPDNKKWNNYSSKRNVNPYTGRKGYKKNEFSSPPVYTTLPKTDYSYKPYEQKKLYGKW